MPAFDAGAARKLGRPASSSTTSSSWSTTGSDEQIGGLIRGQRIGCTRIRAALTQAMPRLPRDHGHLAVLDGSYGYLRQFTPHVLAAVDFAGSTAAADLLVAVDILLEFPDFRAVSR